MSLYFDVTAARPVPFAIEPTLAFRLYVVANPSQAVESVLLRCMIRLAPEQRRYSAAEQERLVEIFGEPRRWADTVKPFLWQNVSLTVGPFSRSTEVDLTVPCSYDLEVAAGKYFHALRDGEVPLLFLFSGTVFSRGERGLVAEQVPWDREARFGLPVAVWQQLMDAYYPGMAWLRLRRETIDALLDYKARHALPTWDDAVEALLAGREVQA